MNKNITNETLKKYARMGAKAFMTNPGYVLSCKDENKKEDKKVFFFCERSNKYI